MHTALMILLAVAAVGVVYVLLPMGLDTNTFVEVDLDARFAALTSLRGKPTLRVKQCARWQDAQSQSCAQECLHGVDALALEGHGLLTRAL